MDELLAIVDDPQQLEDLCSDRLAGLVFSAAVHYGVRQDARVIDALAVLYPAFREKEDEPTRKTLYSNVVGEIESESTGHEALAAFMSHETSASMVTTAALDFAVFHPVVNGDPMSGPKAVLELFNENSVQCRAGLFNGLLLLGDDRVCDLLRNVRGQLTAAELRVVCGTGSGYPFESPIEFLIDWLEEAETEGDDAKYGFVAGALGNQVNGAMFPAVVAARRRFPAESQGGILEDGREMIPLDEFAQTIGPRLRALAEREPPPQVMPIVLGAWGLES